MQENEVLDVGKSIIHTYGFSSFADFCPCVG